jgi:hypothetical protein
MLYRAYQVASTLIHRGFVHGALSTDEFWYREWLSADQRFLDELRRVASTPARRRLHDEVSAVGWGESVRQALPTPPAVG